MIKKSMLGECHNHSLGLMTKAKANEGASEE
jgi:hypothetical protein